MNQATAVTCPKCWNAVNLKLQPRQPEPMIEGWIVELGFGVYLSTGLGDPARTLTKEHAEVFSDRDAAVDALRKARAYRPFPNARIVPAETAQEEKVCSLSSRLKDDLRGEFQKR